MASGQLYLVATPIGNLQDITLRALEVLRTVAVVACEDTRVTRKLLDHYEIPTPVTSYHAHSDAGVAERLVRRVEEGESVALVTDAGTPLLSDPGAELVGLAIERGVDVVPIPGASALLAAVTASGLPTNRIQFLGFLPRADGERREVLSPLRGFPTTVVVYESPRRLTATLDALRRSLGDRRAAVAREMTKHFETFERGRLSELVERFPEAPKGEVVVVVGPPEQEKDGTEEAPAAARALLRSGVRPTEAAKTLAGRFGLAKKEAYELVMAVKTEATADEEQRSLEALLSERLRAYVESLQGHQPENMYGLIMPQLERPLIRVAMELSGGRQVQAAQMLGIHRNTLRTRLRALGLDGEPES